MAKVRDRHGGPLARDSWPLYTPTVPTLAMTDHNQSHPYYRGYYQQQHQMIQKEIALAHQRSQSMGARQLPLPPRPALVTGNWVTATMGPTGGYYTLQDLVKQGRSISNPTPTRVSPARSTSRHHIRRQSSTDSSLHEILKSTEKRLQQGSPTKTRAGTSSTRSRHTSSRETLMARSDNPTDGTASCRSCNQSCNSSPTKSIADHQRGASDSSTASEPESLISAQGRDSQDLPTGLSSPSRTPKSRRSEGNRSAMEDSPTDSVSSGLPTLYSEDEEQDEVPGFPHATRMRAAKAQSMSPSNNDPFVSPSASPSRTTASQPAMRNMQTLRRLPVPLRNTTFGNIFPPPLDPNPPGPLISRYSHAAGGATQTYLDLPDLPPLDLYQLCTPVQQTALKTPTIVRPTPQTTCDSVRSKRSNESSYFPSSSPPEREQPDATLAVPALILPTKLRTPGGHVRVLPPPHILRAKGSSPTLGDRHYALSSSPGPTPQSADDSSSSSPPRGPRPCPSSGPGSVGGDIADLKRDSVVLSTIRTGGGGGGAPRIWVRPPSTASSVGSNSVYSATQQTESREGRVVDTVAALRRMNSTVSTGSWGSETSYAVLSVAGNRGSRDGSGMGSPKRRSGKGATGSRNYLGLLDVGRGGKKMGAVMIWDEKEKENDGRSGKGGQRGSVDSLGLYDSDGFLISSPVRNGE
jgi:hypothetical protein